MYKEVIYYYYDHLFLRSYPKLLKLVQDCIKEHDFYTFQALQYMLNRKYDWGENGSEIEVEFLPNYVYVRFHDDDESILLPLTEELFNQITHSEYECG